MTPPPGITLRTQEQKDLYKVSIEFERFFRGKHMMKGMTDGTKALTAGSGGDDEGAAVGAAGNSTYTDMAGDQMVQSLLDGGGMGIASTIYGQMATAMGIDDAAAAPSEAPAEPADDGSLA